MHSTAQINAIVNNAKTDRADYIGAKLQDSVLPLAFAALLSFALVQFAGAPNQAQVGQGPVTDVSAQNG